jgi:hypothetical protein
MCWKVRGSRAAKDLLLASYTMRGARRLEKLDSSFAAENDGTAGSML